MKTKSTLAKLLLAYALLLGSNSNAQSHQITTTNQSINKFLTENNKNINDLQVIFLSETSGKLTLLTGEAFGILQSNKNEIVIFIPDTEFDYTLLKLKVDNNPSIVLSKNKVIALDLSKTNTISYKNSSINIKL